MQPALTMPSCHDQSSRRIALKHRRIIGLNLEQVLIGKFIIDYRQRNVEESANAIWQRSGCSFRTLVPLQFGRLQVVTRDRPIFFVRLSHPELGVNLSNDTYLS